MSYDLFLAQKLEGDHKKLSPSKVLATVRNLKRAEYCEIFGLEDDGPVEGQRLLVSICLGGDDTETAHFWKSLVTYAKNNGLTIVDPQYDGEFDIDNPGYLPPGFGPVQPPEKRKGPTLATALKRKITEVLVPKGFVQHDKWTAIRPGDGLFQGLLFQKGTSSLSGKMAVEVFLNYDEAMEKEYGMTGAMRLPDGQGQDRWFDIDGDRMDVGLSEIFEQIERVALPYLDSLRSFQQVAEAMRSGKYPGSQLCMNDKFPQYCLERGMPTEAALQAAILMDRFRSSTRGGGLTWDEAKRFRVRMTEFLGLLEAEGADPGAVEQARQHLEAFGRMWAR